MCKVHYIDERNITVKEWHWTVLAILVLFVCLLLIEALLHLKLHLDNVLAITEQMMTLTTTLTGLF